MNNQGYAKAMKLTILLSFLFSIHAMGSATAQKMTLRAANQPLEQVLDELQRQSGYAFIYKVQYLKSAKPVSVQIESEHIEEILHAIFSKQPFGYRVHKKVITLVPKAPLLKAGINQPEVQQPIRGRVTGAGGEVLEGVTVQEKGTNNGTTTGADGVFSLTATTDAILVFRYVGYESKELPAATSFMNVALTEDLAAIEEVVVVGYGTQKRADLIGSVAQVDAEQINNRTTPQLSQALTGQMPGVSVIQRSGQPGASGGTVSVRGVGSFGAGTGALVLVDGIPSSMNDVDPNDVASISVLKDASTAAIYGARAANGVILVTTKTGADTDRLKVSYNGYVGVQRPTAFPEMADSWEFATAVNETTAGGGYTDEEIQLFKDGSDPDNYPNSDYLSEFFEPNALQTGHNLSISNNTDKGQYLLSVGYMGQDGILEKNTFQRYNVRLNLVSNLGSRVKLTTRLSGTQTADNQPAAPATLDFENMVNMISQVVRYPSIYPIRLSNGDWGPGVVQKGNPISFLDSESFFRERTTDLGGNARLDWTVIDDLKLSAIGGYTQFSSRNKRFRATQRINDAIFLAPATLNQSNPYNNYKTFQALAEYDKALGAHHIKALAGYSFEAGYTEGFTAFRQDFASNDLTELNAGSADGQQNTGTAAEWALESLFGRVQYNYANRYLLEGVLRYDGSSRFPTDQKYALFPSVAVGWRLGQEDFLRNQVDWLTDLKLKASWGVLGNQNALLPDDNANYYPYQSTLATKDNYYPFSSIINTGVALTTLIDPTLRWESTRTADIGLEGSLLNNELEFSATYFDRYTYDILVSPASSVSDVLGFEVGLQNSGKLKNTGWEFTLAHRKGWGEWSYRASANLTVVNNEVMDLGVGNVTQPNGLVGNGSSLFIGYPMEVYYGYLTDGLFVDEADVDDWADLSAINPNAQPGDIRYRDVGGPDGVPDGKIDQVYDRVILGSRIPEYSYGINLGVNYKGIDLGVLLQGVGGVNGYLNNHAGWAFYNNGNLQRWQFDGRWTPDNPNRDAIYPRMEQISNTGTGNTLVSDFWMLDGSYLRLKNVQLGYQFPKQVLDRLHMHGMRIYLNAENLHTWSSYRKGWDPEVNTGGAYYPILRNFTLGLHVDF